MSSSILQRFVTVSLTTKFSLVLLLSRFKILALIPWFFPGMIREWLASCDRSWRKRARARRSTYSGGVGNVTDTPILPWRQHAFKPSILANLLPFMRVRYRADEPHGSTWYLEQINAFLANEKERAWLIFRSFITALWS